MELLNIIFKSIRNGFSQQRGIEWMKILHIAKFNDDKANGIRTVVPNHVIEQAKHEEVLFQNVLPYQIENLKYQVPFDKKNWPFNIQDLAGEQFIPDLVIFHGFYHIEMVVLAKKLVKAKIPYIIVPHGSLTKKAQQIKRLKKIIGNIVFFNTFLKRAKAVQFLSKDEEQSSKVKNNNFIGTNGINLPNKSKSKFNNNQINFVYIGRIDKFHKGLDLLLEAIVLTRELLQKNNCKFLLYGPRSKDFEFLQNMIQEENLQDFVLLNDAIFGEVKEQVLLETDIFIQTSRFEGMPMGILEALCYGLPCVVTEGTTLGVYIKEYNAGWVAEINAESIYQTLVRVIEERGTLQAKSGNARKLITQEFAWEKIAKETIEKYKEFM